MNVSGNTLCAGGLTAMVLGATVLIFTGAMYLAVLSVGAAMAPMVSGSVLVAGGLLVSAACAVRRLLARR